MCGIIFFVRGQKMSDKGCYHPPSFYNIAQGNAFQTYLDFNH